MHGQLFPREESQPLLDNNGKYLKMNFTLKTILYGILVWLVPFLIAIPFYSPEGTLLVDVPNFKSIIVPIFESNYNMPPNIKNKSNPAH